MQRPEQQRWQGKWDKKKRCRWDLELPEALDERGRWSLSKVSAVGLDPESRIERQHLILNDGNDHPTSTAPVVATKKNLNLSQMLQTLPTWILLYTCMVLEGRGTVTMNNVDQMSKALQFLSVMASASLTLFSSTQSAAKVATGLFQRRHLHGPGLATVRASPGQCSSSSHLCLDSSCTLC